MAVCVTMHSSFSSNDIRVQKKILRHCFARTFIITNDGLFQRQLYIYNGFNASLSLSDVVPLILITSPCSSRRHLNVVNALSLLFLNMKPLLWQCTKMTWCACRIFNFVGGVSKRKCDTEKATIAYNNITISIHWRHSSISCHLV